MENNESNKETLVNLVIGLNKLLLSSKKNIKKYTKLRKLHSEIVDSMENYMFKNKEEMTYNYNKINKYISKDIDDLNYNLDFSNEDDITILDEIYIYKNHSKLESVTQIYIKEKKFKSKEKVKMLKSMDNSYVGLFKVIGADSANGYVTYQDVFTNKVFKVIDISLSSSYRVDKDNELYLYNRIITFDDISFTTGIHCIFTGNSKKIIEFIKNHNHKECSDLARCLLLYNIAKDEDENDFKMTYNHNY